LGQRDIRRARDADVNDAQFAEAIAQFLPGYALRPDWNEDVLQWILQHASIKHRHGKLFRRTVYGKGDRLLGCYVYYVRPGGIAWVLQVFAHPDSRDAVVDSLLAHASAQGAIAVRGRAQPEMSDAFLRHHSVFLHRSSTVIHSRSPEVMNTIRLGDALLVGLTGEAWTQLIGGIFE
jgi:hypothetical protein